MPVPAYTHARGVYEFVVLSLGRAWSPIPCEQRSRALVPVLILRLRWRADQSTELRLLHLLLLYRVLIECALMSPCL